MKRWIPQATKVCELLKQYGLRVATAESCTGGMLSGILTEVPGASDVFDLGIVSYAASAKCRILGVRTETVQQYGVISRQTAREMAVGVRRLARADLGISITGVAGPDAAEGKSPGTVYIALASAEKVDAKKLCIPDADRHTVRQVTCGAALAMLTEYLEGRSENGPDSMAETML